MKIVNANILIVPMSTDYIMNKGKQIVESCRFRVFYETNRFMVTVELTGDSDNYLVKIYDQSKECDRFEFDDSNKICTCTIDSSGSAISDELLHVIPLGNNYWETLDDVEIAIYDHLFGNSVKGVKGVIIGF